MTDFFVEVSPGGPPADQDIADGIYPVVLTGISDPKTVTARRGKNAGKDIDLIDWTFAVNDPGNQYDAREFVESTSTATGPRSKMYEWLTALFNGVAPAIGTRLQKGDLIGRQAYATISHDEGGWPRISQLAGIPVAHMQRQFAQTTGAPVQAPGAPAPAAAAPQPLREAVAAGVGAPAAPPTDELPF